MFYWQCCSDIFLYNKGWKVNPLRLIRDLTYQNEIYLWKTFESAKNFFQFQDRRSLNHIEIVFIQKHLTLAFHSFGYDVLDKLIRRFQSLKWVLLKHRKEGCVSSGEEEASLVDSLCNLIKNIKLNRWQQLVHTSDLTISSHVYREWCQKLCIALYYWSEWE